MRRILRIQEKRRAGGPKNLLLLEKKSDAPGRDRLGRGPALPMAYSRRDRRARYNRRIRTHRARTGRGRCLAPLFTVMATGPRSGKAKNISRRYGSPNPIRREILIRRCATISSTLEVQEVGGVDSSESSSRRRNKGQCGKAIRAISNIYAKLGFRCPPVAEE